MNVDGLALLKKQISGYTLSKYDFSQYKPVLSTRIWFSSLSDWDSSIIDWAFLGQFSFITKRFLLTNLDPSYNNPHICLLAIIAGELPILHVNICATDLLSRTRVTLMAIVNELSFSL